MAHKDNRQPRRKPDTAPALRLAAQRERHKIQRHALNYRFGPGEFIAALGHYHRVGYW